LSSFLMESSSTTTGELWSLLSAPPGNEELTGVELCPGGILFTPGFLGALLAVVEAGNNSRVRSAVLSRDADPVKEAVELPRSVTSYLLGSYGWYRTTHRYTQGRIPAPHGSQPVADLQGFAVFARRATSLAQRRGSRPGQGEGGPSRRFGRSTGRRSPRRTHGRARCARPCSYTRKSVASPFSRCCISARASIAAASGSLTL
jgi:hypothetical protein